MKNLINRLTISILFIGIQHSLYSQIIEVGPKTDISGQLFNGYYSPFTYSSLNNLNVNYNKKFEKGSFTTLDGKKTEGFIKLDENKIYFKPEKGSFIKKIKAENIKFVKIGIDSFFTSSNFYSRNKLKKKPEFLQYIAEINGNIFAQHFDISTNYVEKQLLVRNKKNDKTWYNFYDAKLFKVKALKSFGHIPQLKLKIETEKYSKNNMMSMIKTAEYYSKFKNKSNIFYDKYWQEIPASKKAKYKAVITSKKDSILTFQYFENTSKLYQINYSSFYPNIKDGLQTSFHKNGNPREVILYDNNKVKEVKIYNTKGLLTKHYKNISTGKDSTLVKRLPKDKKKKKYTYKDKKPEINYIVLTNSDGKNIVNESGNFINNITDDKTGYKYTNCYKKHKLVKSYRLSNSDTIFQIVKNELFNTFNLQAKLNDSKELAEFSNALENNAQGTILINVLIDPKGYVVKSEVLNKCHPELDSFISGFIFSKFPESAKFRFKFKRNRNTPKVFYETIIPISFANDRFYRRPVRYDHFYNFHHFMWQQQQMQMQMQQSINNAINNLPNGGRVGF